jgi:hypothetical protein
MLDVTAAHLAVADENRLFAEALIVAELRPAPFRWVPVVAFYAAVHYVNAYLWEKRQIEPTSHSERNHFVNMAADLRPIAIHYARLEDAAFRARYLTGYRSSRETAHRHVATNLSAIQRQVVPLLVEPE